MRLIAPINFRLGKTFPWKNNFLLPNDKNSIQIAGDLGLTVGLEHFCNYLLQAYTIFAIRGVIRFCFKTGTLMFNLLYAPRMKEKTFDGHYDIDSDPISNFLYSSRLYTLQYQKYIRQYFRDALNKTALSKSNKAKPQRREWVTSRMFRGSKPLIWNMYTANSRLKNSFFLKKGPVKLKNSYFIKGKRIKLNNNYFFKRQWIKLKINYYLKGKKVKLINRRLINNQKIQFKKSYLLNGKWVKLKTTKWSRYRNQFFDKKQNTGILKHSINDRIFTNLLATSLGRKIKVKTLNIFTYFVKKGLMTYKTHQKHFWIHAFRNRRWIYPSYWDIINAFYIVGTVMHSENFLLNVLKIVLSNVAEKPRRAFYFLDSIIKNLPQIFNNFSCFRITANGKLNGGTKRTDSIVVGYGRLAVNSLFDGASNNFLSYAHRYGAFGVHFIMCRRYKPL